MASVEELARAADGAARAYEWDHWGDGVTARSSDGSEEAAVRVVAGAYEGRVWRYDTGPGPGPEPKPVHGPQAFERPDDALGWCESNMSP